MIENQKHTSKRIFIGAFIKSERFIKNYRELKKEFASLVPARWTKAENLHITAFFYGNATTTTMNKIRKALSPVLGKSIECHLLLAGLGVFYKNSQPHILYINPKDDKEVVPKVIREIQTRLLTQNIIAQVPKKHHPHITLARIKKANDKFENMVKAYQTTVFDTVSRLQFEVIESVLTPEGPIYKTIQI